MAQETYGCDEPIRFRAACVDSLSDDYFHRVRLFKFNNGFRPDERINPPKMAALMVEACKRCDGDAPLFMVPPSLQGKAIDHMAYLQYIYALIVSTLFIRLDEVPPVHERDLFLRLDGFNIPTEWLCWSLYNFARAYGEIRDDVGE